MSWLTGSVTVRRFEVNGLKPKDPAAYLDRLRAFRVGTGPAGEVEIGWAAGDSVLDTAFTELKNVWPDHLLWDLQTTTDRPPADLFRAYYRTELAALAAGNPSGFPTARQKREAKEYATDRLEDEAKDGRFRKRKCDGVLWDTTRNEVWFGSTSAAAAGRLGSLFVRTFAERTSATWLAHGLVPVSAGTIAVDRYPHAAAEILSPFTPATPDEVAWDPVAAYPDFLGNEFLLWLWWHAEAGPGDTLALLDGSEATYVFSGGVRLECPNGDGEDTINAASGVRTPEARAAIAAGKLPRKAALTVVRNGEQFSFKLEAETLAIVGGKLPAPDDKAAGRGRDEDRLQAVRDLVEVVEQMYLAFLAVRLSPAAWDDLLPQLRAWVGGRKAVAA